MWFIGDIHGDFQRYSIIINKLEHEDKVGLDCSIQVGDFGIFNENDAKQAPQYPQHKFFRGNHDNPTLCRKQINYLGDCQYLPNLEMFTLAGGYSIDHKRRVEGKNFWFDEELNWKELYQAVELYADHKPKIVASHEAPTIAKLLSTNNKEKKRLYNSRTENALQAMFDAHQPEIWVYGHFHRRVNAKVNNTLFIGLGDHRTDFFDQIYEIPGLTWD